jgi:hypothetical protein
MVTMLNFICSLLAERGDYDVTQHTIYHPTDSGNIASTASITNIHAAPARTRGVSDASQNTCSDRSSDSGYASGEHQGSYSPNADTTQWHPNSALDDMSTDGNDIENHVEIRHEHLLYAIIAVLVTFIIDKKLLLLPVFGLVMVVMLYLTFAPSSDVERAFDLSIFRIVPKIEVRYKKIVELKYVEKIAEVKKIVEVEKIIEKSVDNETIAKKLLVNIAEKMSEVGSKATPVHAQVQTAAYAYIDSTTLTNAPINAIAQVQADEEKVTEIDR